MVNSISRSKASDSKLSARLERNVVVLIPGSNLNWARTRFDFFRIPRPLYIRSKQT